MPRIVNAREHRILAGRLDRSRLGLGERLVTKAPRTPDGDYRPWDEVRAWAAGIAAALEQG